MNNKKAIAYLRVSSKDQVDGSSLDNQIERIKSYCTTYGLELTEIISDEGLTGRNTNREGFQTLMSKVQKKECEAVIVYSLSRFARSTVDCLQNIEQMTSKNIAFHSISEKIDTDSAQGRFFLTIISALAELESRQMGERIKSVKQNNKEKLRTYSSPLMGFSSGPKQAMTVNQDEMDVVNYIIHSAKTDKMSYDKIAKKLNQEEIPTKFNKKWHAFTVWKIANNSVYNNVSPALLCT